MKSEVFLAIFSPLCHIVAVMKLEGLYYLLCFSRHTLRSVFMIIAVLKCARDGH